MRKNDDKFEFVDIEELINDNSSEKEKVPALEKANSNDEDTGKKKGFRIHFSFEVRIITFIVLILFLFFTACFLAFNVINHTTHEELIYKEYTTVNYKVCLKNSSCVDENNHYNVDDLDNIKISFDYNADYDEIIKYNNSYYINAISRVYNKEDNSIIYYEKENYLVDNTELKGKDKSFSINESVTLDYNKYKELINDYNRDDSYSEVEVVLYLTDKNETRKISSLVIPLVNDNMVISKNNKDELTRIEDREVSLWDSYSITCAIFSSLLTICSLFAIYKVSKLVFDVYNNRSRYEQEVDNILKKYDSIIVVARDGYETISEKEIVKLDTFDNLLEVKNNINKPVIFSKINDVKCEFIIEDDEKLYKYVLKEADFQK
ncbi:MAG: hypothetical protein IJ097_03575 [Bacilli bacterium]|nr:hypothetical protein [Bacilli bacterium]